MHVNLAADGKEESFCLIFLTSVR